MTDSDSRKDKAERSWSLIGSPKSRSISRDLTAGLILTVVVVSTIAILFSYFDASRKARSQLEDKADEYLVSLTDILEIPLWNLDDRTIEHIGASYAQNELVQELRVIDSWGTAYFEFEKESGESQTSRASEIFHENESVGQVELSLTSRYYTEINRQLLGSSIFTILINLLSLIIVIGFLSRMLLGKPLERLGEIVNSYASDEYDSSGHHMPFVEFQPLVTVLGEMGDKITAQMTELQEHRQHLEDLVEQRTEELSQRNIELGREIGERKRAEETLKTQARILESMVEGVNVSDENAIIFFTNPAFDAMFGYERGELIGKHVSILNAHPPEENVRIVGEIVEQLKTRGAWSGEFSNIKQDGTLFTTHVRISALEVAGRQYWVSVQEDITERKRAEEALRTMLLVDELTGLHNRRGFFNLAEQQLKVADWTKRRKLLVFADLDHLKQINDALGHREGDRALIEIANVLKETFRESDIIARIGGDEFVVLAIETDEASAEVLSTRLQENLEARNTTGGRRYELSLSVGVAHYDPEHPCSVDELLARADRSMYEKKQDNQRS